MPQETQSKLLYKSYEDMKDRLLSSGEYKAFMSPATLEQVIYLIREIETVKADLVHTLRMMKEIQNMRSDGK